MRAPLLASLASIGLIVIGASAAAADGFNGHPLAFSGKPMSAPFRQPHSFDGQRVFSHHFFPRHSLVNPLFFHPFHRFLGFNFIDFGWPFSAGFADPPEGTFAANGFPSSAFASPIWNLAPAAPAPPTADERGSTETTPEGVTIFRGPGSHPPPY